MFKSKGLFSSVTCPYNVQCVLPQCLFGHPKSRPSSGLEAPDAVQAASSGGPSDITTGFADNPNKRRKLEGGKLEPVATKSAQVRSDPTGKTSAAPATNVASKPPSSLLSQSRDVSPPAVKRSSVPTSAASTNNEKPISKDAAASKAPKTETLNPRMLKNSATPHNIRLKLVQLLHDQFVRLNRGLSKDACDSEIRLVLSPQALITKALDIEERAGMEKPAIHSSVVKNVIIRYKKMTVAEWKKERQIEERAKVEATTKARHPAKVIQPIETGLRPHSELAVLSKLYTSTADFTEHGYVNVIPGEESIARAKAGVIAAQGFETCDRCNQRFQVYFERRESDGVLCSGGACTYHWGKPCFPQKQATDVRGTKREKRYRCCGQALGDSSGCTAAKTHVYKVTEVKRLASVLNFIETPENDDANEDDPICIDGEMGYTTLGLELIRLTATSWSSSTLLDVLVRPYGVVLDLNSRWSGVMPSQLVNAPMLKVNGNGKEYDPAQVAGEKALHIVESPAAARELLLTFLTPQTPVIGHGLENDLNAVRLIHLTIVDTALLFAHPRGLPYRNALRTLVAQHLGRTIQAGGGLIAGDDLSEGAIAAGHDSKEDANAAGDLVRWAVAREWEKMRRIGWTLKDGSLVPPQRLSTAFLEDNPMKEVSKISAGVKRSNENLEENQLPISG